MPLNQTQKSEIESSRSDISQTSRAHSPGMEKHLHHAYEILDHGFVRVVDYMGNDASICQAARVSYGKGTKSARDDEGLIRYLMRHKHWTPFEMCEIKLHVKMPIFIARQWIRHRTASVNEYSARYSILDREFYFPQENVLAAQSTANNQGRGHILTGKEAQNVLNILRDDAMNCYDHYEEMISQDGQQGLARELARMNLPTNIYTQWYWKVNLRNLFNFLHLRADSHAQHEIQVYAKLILNIVKDWVPAAHGAFEEYILHGASFSQSALSCIRRMLDGENVTEENSNLSKREWGEFQNLLKNQSQ